MRKQREKEQKLQMTGFYSSKIHGLYYRSFGCDKYFQQGCRIPKYIYNNKPVKNKISKNSTFIINLTKEMKDFYKESFNVLKNERWKYLPYSRVTTVIIVDSKK